MLPGVGDGFWVIGEGGDGFDFVKGCFSEAVEVVLTSSRDASRKQGGCFWRLGWMLLRVGDDASVPWGLGLWGLGFWVTG